MAMQLSWRDLSVGRQTSGVELVDYTIFAGTPLEVRSVNRLHEVYLTFFQVGRWWMGVRIRNSNIYEQASRAQYGIFC